MRSLKQICGALLLMLLLTSCATQKPPQSSWIAAIHGDLELADHIQTLFDENDIVGGAAGSVGYGIRVRDEDRDRAIELLRRDAEQNGYWIKFTEE